MSGLDLPPWVTGSGHFAGVPDQAEPECDGRCLWASDLGMPQYERDQPAYPDPDCSLHGDNPTEEAR
jgi:hypothetical protein